MIELLQAECARAALRWRCDPGDLLTAAWQAWEAGTRAGFSRSQVRARVRCRVADVARGLPAPAVGTRRTPAPQCHLEDVPERAAPGADPVEARDEARAALARVRDPADRRALVLRYALGLSVGQVARAVGLRSHWTLYDHLRAAKLQARGGAA